MAEDNELHLACMDARPVRSALRYVALAVGCVAVGVAFTFDLFAVYGETLKLAFGFSQKELALIISAANLGMISALPSGLLVLRYDPRWLSGAAFCLSTVSSALIWGTTYHLDFYRQHFYVLAIFYFLLGCAGGFMYMLALSVNLLNFSPRHAGVISGAVHCMRSVVLGALLVVYDVMYGRFNRVPVSPVSPVNGTQQVQAVAEEAATGDYKHVRHLQLFFELMLLVYGAVNFLACVFYGNYRDVVEEEAGSDNGTVNELLPIRTTGPVYGTNTLSSSLAGSTTTMNSSTTVTTTVSDTADLVADPPGGGGGDEDSGPWRQLLRNKLFHQLLWPSVFLLAMRNAYITNLSIVLATFGLQASSRLVTYAVPLVGAVCPPLLGALTDLVGHKVPRSLFYLLSAVGLLALNLANMGFAGRLVVVAITVVWSQLALSAVQTLGPSLHLRLFGGQTFPAGWGLVMLLQTLFTLLAQLLMAALYDAFTPEGALLCSGFQCYIIYFFIVALFTYACVVVLFFLVRHEFETNSSSSR